MTVSLPIAIQVFRSGRLEAARRLCLVCLAQDPGLAGALNLLAVCLFNAGRPGDAVPVLERVVRLQPDLADALGNLAVALQISGLPAEAAARFRQLIAQQPASVLGLSRLAGFLNDDGDLAGAERLLTRAVRVDPGNAQERLNLALIRRADAAIPGAVACLKSVLALVPEGAAGHTQFGAAQLGLGDVVGAAAAFSRALALEPGNQEALQGLTRAGRYLQAGRAALDPGVRPGTLLRGPLTPVSGYGHMTCRFLEHLLKRKVPLQTIGLFGAEQWPGTEAPVRARVALHCLTPPAVEPVPGVRTVVFSMFEGPRVPSAWKRYSDRHDLLIVPCEASRLAWMEQGYPAERIRICPLGVDAVTGAGALLSVTDRRGRPVSAYRRRVLNISDFVSRKNIDGLLRVWLKATRPDDDAVLILKLGKGSAASRRAIEELITRTEREAGRRLDEAAAVALIDQRLSEEEMDGLYRASTHYWSLSHGEGWDLPLTRAGAHGLGLVAPRHSAYEDYLDDGVARLIPARVVPAYEPGGTRYYPPFHGLTWWEPDEDAACTAIADIVSGRGAPLPDARPHLLGRFTWEHATDRLCAILDEAATL